ncbi:MAG: hypothetical protein E7667_06345 [Ruminococcaceae bacterium]|nr:hypothetical protein [Oscillospiraceae bacterium]
MDNSKLVSNEVIEKILSQKKYNIVYDYEERNEKRLAPMYTIHSYVFYPSTRVVVIVFHEVAQYRTIERYVQYNYQKMPIYSDWKQKEAYYEEKLTLTNQELERLHCHKRFLIRNFAHQIVFRTKDPSIYPSWFLKDMIKEEFLKEKLEIEQAYGQWIEKCDEKIKFLNNGICENNQKIKYLKSRYQHWHGRELKQIKRINRCKACKKSLWKSIITFGIYNYYISLRNIERMSNAYYKYVDMAADIQREISNLQDNNASYQLEIDANTEKIRIAQSKQTRDIDQETYLYNKKISEVVVLPQYWSMNTDGFIPLKMFVGYNSTKQQGCYIIHNRENGKCYVGQSKNVYERILKQHFRGTQPKNEIFFEDYYNSSWKNKEDLFEIKIVPCKTRDELDAMEKRLIQQYDSKDSGYNRTRGNS